MSGGSSSPRDTQRASVRIRRVDRPADQIAVITLESATTQPLPSWEPGAHVSIRWDDELTRDYSLCGRVEDPMWRIAVQATPNGRGGSERVVREATVGRLLQATVLNTFPFVPAPHVVFLAGGIGITPILPMVDAAQRAGVDCVLHAAASTRTRLLDCDRIARLPGTTISISSEGEHMDLPRIVAEAPHDAQFYACGPERMLAELESLLPGDPRLHLEHFSPTSSADAEQDEPFEVELASTGEVVTVSADQSVLARLEEAGAFVISSCREGTCGTCETGVLEGSIDHRDMVLTPEERAENTRMMICVSRACHGCPRIVLDL